MRVLRVIDRLGYGERLHGAGRVWLNSLPAFGNGCQVIPCVLRLPPSIEQQFTQEGIRLQHLRKGRLNPFTIVTFCRLIRREGVDVLHLEGFGAATFGRIAGLLTGTPAIVHLHDRHRSVPWYVRVADWCLANSTSKVIAVSRDAAQSCARRLHVPAERVVVVPNAIRAGWAQPIPAERLERLRRELGIPEAARVIGTVAHLQEEKAVPSFIEAVAHLRATGQECHAVVAGDGPDRAAIERQIATLGLTDRVHLVGFQPDVRPYLALMDVVVFSSLREGCPNTLLEAMAMGRPIVATAAGGIPEVVRDGHNGLLVPVGDVQAIARAVERLLKDPALATRLATQVKKDASTYEMPAHVARLQAIYAEVASRNGNGKIKIVHLCDKLAVDTGVAGIARRFSLTVPRSSLRFELRIYTLRGEDVGCRFLKERGIAVHPMGKSKFDPATLFSLLRLVKRERPALIHAHGFASSNLSRAVSLLTGIPVVVHENFCYAIPWYQRVADRLLAPLTTRAIAVSESIKTFMVEKRSVPSNLIRVVYGGIVLDHERNGFPASGRSTRSWSITQAYNIPAAHQVVSIVGRLHPAKGQRVVLEAAPAVIRQVPQVTFLFAGAGADRDRLEALASRLQIEPHVRFPGFVADVDTIYAQSDIVVIPSLSDAFPNSALEAMQQGCPVIASGVEGLLEVFEDERNGLLVPPGQPAPLAAKLIRLLQDGELRKRLSQHAREDVQKFSISNVVRRTEQVYDEVLSLKRG